MHKQDERPSLKELIKWAAEMRTKYHCGELPQWQIDELNKMQGWTWDAEEAKRLER